MKKRYFVICPVLLVLSIGLILFDLLVASVPAWVVGCNIALTVINLVFFYLKANAKRGGKILITAITLLTVCFSLFGLYCNPYWNSYNFRANSSTEDYNREISYKQAKEDIDYMLKYIKKDHPLFRKNAPDNFTAAYEKAVSELKSSSHITVSMLWQKTQSILSTLGDGHTCAYANYKTPHYLKYRAELKAGNYDLTKVNGISMEKLFQEKNSLFSYEAESLGKEMLKIRLLSLEGLDFLGIPISDGIVFTYKNDNGNTVEKTCYAKDFLTYGEYIKYNNIKDDNKTKENFVSYSIEEDKSLALLTLTACNYNKQYRDCLNKMFSEVKEKNIKNVAVDIRDNGGGNSLVADEFIKYLDTDTYKVSTDKWRLGLFNINNKHNIQVNHKYSDLTFSGRVYILTSVGTFSSAMQFAEHIKDNRLGVIIGEAPGNNAYGYGDIAIFRMPNSKLYFQVSTKQFFRADPAIKDKWVIPDVPCDSKDALTVLYQQL
ncbi:S41 family peptidase [Anaerocolumna xylanovorans]|nr:S41 family peptidase [Anaerocolumna xylanovorans]